MFVDFSSQVAMTLPAGTQTVFVHGPRRASIIMYCAASYIPYRARQASFAVLLVPSDRNGGIVSTVNSTHLPAIRSASGLYRSTAPSLSLPHVIDFSHCTEIMVQETWSLPLHRGLLSVIPEDNQTTVALKSYSPLNLML